MRVLLLPLASRFLPYTTAVAATVLLLGTVLWQPGLVAFLSVPIALAAGLAVLGTAISSRPGTRSCAIIRFQRTCGFCWRKSGRKCVNIFRGRETRPAVQPRQTRRSLSACEECPR